MNVTVFGSSTPVAGQDEYEQAYFLGQKLAKAGHTNLNGGYIGTMEAVSKGGSEAGGRVIGVVCDEIEAWRPVHANIYISEEVRLPSLKERLYYLIEAGEAYIALPGGVGTLAEIAMTWNQMQTEVIPARPFILVGTGWHLIFQSILERQAEHIKPMHAKQLHFAADAESAFALLEG